MISGIGVRENPKGVGLKLIKTSKIKFACLMSFSAYPFDVQVKKSTFKEKDNQVLLVMYKVHNC